MLEVGKKVLFFFKSRIIAILKLRLILFVLFTLLFFAAIGLCLNNFIVFYPLIYNYGYVTAVLEQQLCLDELSLSYLEILQAIISKKQSLILEYLNNDRMLQSNINTRLPSYPMAPFGKILKAHLELVAFISPIRFITFFFYCLSLPGVFLLHSLDTTLSLPGCEFRHERYLCATFLTKLIGRLLLDYETCSRVEYVMFMLAIYSIFRPFLNEMVASGEIPIIII